MKRSLKFFVFLCLALGSALATASNNGITDIVLPAFRSYQITGLNNVGQAVGYFSLPGFASAENFRAFMWDGTLHVLPDFGHGAVATGINDAGEIVGYYYDAAENVHVARFTTTSVTDLGLPQGSSGPINNSGDFIYTSSQCSVVNIRTLASRPISFPATLINDSGAVAGGQYVDVGLGAVNMLALLPVPPDNYDQPYCDIYTLTPDSRVYGQEVATGGRGTPLFDEHFTWDSVSGIQLLGQYPPSKRITSVNGNGEEFGMDSNDQPAWWHEGIQSPLSELTGPGIPNPSFVNNRRQMILNGQANGQSIPQFFDPSLVSLPVNIVLGNTGTFDYDGGAHAATATAYGYGNQAMSTVPTITYTPGGSNPPVEPGTYEVTATISGVKFYEDTSVTGTIVIQSTQAPTTVQVVGGVYTYDGFAHPASGSVSSSGTPVASPGVTLTYAPGGAVAPIFPGTYQVYASFPGSSSYLPSDATGSIVIQNASLSVTANNATMTLNGSLPALTGTMTGMVSGDGISASYSTSAVLGSPVGTYPITPALSDPLGRLGYYNVSVNPGTLTVKYGSNSGIMQPVNTDGSSVFKQGSTVPVKFQVYDANGVSIGTPGVVASFNIVQIISGTVSTVVNEPVLTNNPDANFRWDGSQWIFNVSTKNLAANNTYYFKVLLNDGSSINFRFGLK